MVGGHIVNQRVDPWTIFLPEEVEGPSIAVLSPANQRFIVGQVLVVHSTSTLQIADQTPNKQRKKGKREAEETYGRVGVSAYRRSPGVPLSPTRRYAVSLFNGPHQFQH